MKDYSSDYLVPCFGGGSQTSPTKSWAAIGGYGSWIPRWDLPGKEEHAQREQDRYGQALGQGGSSTRQELMGWIDILTQPFRSHYATDSAAMLNKANQMLEKARQREDAASQKGKPVDTSCPFQETVGITN